MHSTFGVHHKHVSLTLCARCGIVNSFALRLVLQGSDQDKLLLYKRCAVLPSKESCKDRTPEALVLGTKTRRVRAVVEFLQMRKMLFDWQGWLAAGQRQVWGLLTSCLVHASEGHVRRDRLCVKRLTVPCACLLCFDLVHETGAR